MSKHQMSRQEQRLRELQRIPPSGLSSAELAELEQLLNDITDFPPKKGELLK